MKPFDNYVIFRDHKLIYAAIPKAANSTMKKCLIPLLGVADPMKGYHRRTGLFEYCQKREVERSEYFRVTLVRNSWSRLYSCWHEKVFTKLHDPIAKMRYKGIYEGMPFPEFVRAVADIPDERSNAHFRSQYSMITHKDRLIVDLVLPLERIELLLTVIERFTGTKLGPITRRNQSGVDACYSSYTEETIELVYKRYQKEIDLFGFEFGTAQSRMKRQVAAVFSQVWQRFGSPGGGT